MLSPGPLQHRGIPGAKRCYLCNGPFGLIRHRFALKQFCSKQCLDQYKGKIEGHGSLNLPNRQSARHPKIRYV